MKFLILNILMIIFLPFIMLGIIKKTKAFWGGRKGISILQPFYDFIRLLNKKCVYSETTTLLFKLSPAILLATVFFASIFVPMIKGVSIYDIQFAFVIFAYVLGFGKFFSILSALDTGSSFEGMGASREACFSTIVEPAFFILLASISALSQNYSFHSFKSVLENAGVYGVLVIILAVIVLLIMMLIESCRVPVDDPETHLELTMIHEVMVLDNSGPDLALINWASAIKMFLFSSLIANLVLPQNVSLLVGSLLFLLIIVLISILIGTIESAMARFRMTHVFEFIFIMTILSLLILALVTYKLYGN